MSNEIVTGGEVLNGSYATITTADGLKLENVPIVVQPGQAVGTIGLTLGYGAWRLRKKKCKWYKLALYM
jgi:molybdopterin-containing oxidoreductase family iron-sulfur binding subunit